jgi:hypothetical protein
MRLNSEAAYAASHLSNLGVIHSVGQSPPLAVLTKKVFLYKNYYYSHLQGTSLIKLSARSIKTLYMHLSFSVFFTILPETDANPLFFHPLQGISALSGALLTPSGWKTSMSEK